MRPASPIGASAFMRSLSLSRKQIQSVVQSTATVNLWTGAIRSGKTIASLLRWLMFISSAPYGGQLIMVGRTRESLARNVFAVLQDPLIFGDLAQQVQYTPGAASGTILGRTVYVFGASDSRAEAIVRGLTVAGAYVDEATLMTEAMWVTLIGRMSVAGAQLFATTNPDSPAHWFKTSVVDRAASLGYKLFHYLLTDNQWLVQNNPGYIERIQREYTGLWYRRFILGEWVQAEGAVYEQWNVGRHVIPHASVPTLSQVLSVGIDYGTTNPTRGYLVGLGTDPLTRQTNLYAVDEWAPAAGTDAQLSAQYVAWQRTRQPVSWQAPAWVFVDPAGASFKRQLFEDGITNVVNGHNAVLPGIRAISSLLTADRLKVSDRCPRLIDQIPGYSWDPDATKRGEDKPIKRNDHEVDGLRYAVYSTRALWRDLIPLNAAEVTAAGADEMAA